MSRPRIRSLKPDIWADESVGRLGPWERLLWLGLITMADDEGRLRALPPAIAGFVFPYDPATVRKIGVWLRKLDAEHMVVLYEVDRAHYIHIRNWNKHQRIEKPQASILPPPPSARLSADESPTKSVSNPGTVSDKSETSRAPRARPLLSSPTQENTKGGSSSPLCDLLADLIEKNGSKRPTISKAWCDAERRMLELDGRDSAEAGALIRWCQASDFWRANILSMPKFREKYDQLRLQAWHRSSATEQQTIRQRRAKALRTLREDT